MSKKNDSFSGKLSTMRFTNAQGRIIPMHHAFLTVHMPKYSRITAMVLPLVFLLLVWLALPFIMHAWTAIMEFWMQLIYGVGVGLEETRILGRSLQVPYPLIYADDPSDDAVFWNLVICGLVFLISFIIPRRIAPFTYLMRATLLIQASASIARMVSPDTFPYTLPVYIVDALSLAMYLIFVLPVVLGFVYYIFDFGFIRKVLLTLVMLGYFFLTIPCQYALHAVIIHEWTLLFLPLMYLMFGTLMDVLMFIAIYAFGMSWHSNEKTMQGRGLNT